MGRGFWVFWFGLSSYFGFFAWTFLAYISKGGKIRFVPICFFIPDGNSNWNDGAVFSGDAFGVWCRKQSIVAASSAGTAMAGFRQSVLCTVVFIYMEKLWL